VRSAIVSRFPLPFFRNPFLAASTRPPSIPTVSGPPSSFRYWPGQAAESLFAVLFPSECRICSEPLVIISRLPVCAECLASVHAIAGGMCSVCGERLLSAYAVSEDHGAPRCGLCRRLEPPFVRAVAYGSYEGAVRELIHLLKYHRVKPAAAIVVIPVPLYRGKRNQRGFNQASLIAAAALKHPTARVRLHLLEDVLLRRRETKSQIGLTSHQRRENLRGAFVVARPDQIKGREVLLVDDVYTTGTTVFECTRVLRRAGATRVWVATVARTLKISAREFEITRREDEDGNEDEEARPQAEDSYQGIA
jgi:predicted amidophosphoribosyltransferase